MMIKWKFSSQILDLGKIGVILSLLILSQERIKIRSTAINIHLDCLQFQWAMPLAECLTAHELHGRLCDFQNWKKFAIFRQSKFFVD